MTLATDPAQQTLGGLPPRASKRDDYAMLPDGVYPTPIEVLEQGGNLLFIKRFDHNRQSSPKQQYIFNQMVAFGNATDAPASITVFCIWGVTGTQRAIEKFEPHGHTPKRPCEDVPGAIRDWFVEQRPRR